MVTAPVGKAVELKTLNFFFFFFNLDSVCLLNYRKVHSELLSSFPGVFSGVSSCINTHTVQLTDIGD